MKRAIILALAIASLFTVSASAQLGGCTQRSARYSVDDGQTFPITTTNQLTVNGGAGNDTIRVTQSRSLLTGRYGQGTFGGRIAVDPSDPTGNTLQRRVATGDINGDGRIDSVRRVSGQGSGDPIPTERRSMTSAPQRTQVSDGSSNTLMFGSRRSVQGNHIGTNAVGTYSTQVGPNVRSRRRQ